MSGSSAEDELIARHFAPLAGEAGLGLVDDAACFTPPEGCDIIVTADALVAGVHFFADDPPAAIAKKALRVNLSDLAAKAADPLGFLLSIALPSGFGEGRLATFAQGLGEDARAFGCPLVGGDTVATSGPLTISITAFGSAPRGRMIPRAGAEPGDRLYVTGTIGDAALGLRLRLEHDSEKLFDFSDKIMRRNNSLEQHNDSTPSHNALEQSLEKLKDFSDKDMPRNKEIRAFPDSTKSRNALSENSAALAQDARRHLCERYLLPRPRLELRAALRASAHAAMDVSDGLVGDLAKMLRASRVSARVQLSLAPLSQAARDYIASDAELFDVALTGGDDYEILAAIPGARAQEFEAAAAAAGIAATCVGEVLAGSAPPIFADKAGRARVFAKSSFSHF